MIKLKDLIVLNEFQIIIDSGRNHQYDQSDDEQSFIFYKRPILKSFKEILINDLVEFKENQDEFLELMNEFIIRIQMISKIDGIEIKLSESDRFFKVLVHKKGFKKVIIKSYKSDGDYIDYTNYIAEEID